MGFVTRGGQCQHAAPTILHQRYGLQQQARAHNRGALGAITVVEILVAIQVKALDRHRLLSDVARVLADERVESSSASVTTCLPGDRVAISRFTFEMGDPKHLGHLLDVVRNVEGVFDVYRVTSAA